MLLNLSLSVHEHWFCSIHNLYVHTHAQAQLDEQRAGLQTLVAARRSKLEESIKLHQYLQEVEEVHSWIGERQAIAGSDDYGKDFDHLLVRTFCEDYTIGFFFPCCIKK